MRHGWGRGVPGSGAAQYAVGGACHDVVMHCIVTPGARTQVIGTIQPQGQGMGWTTLVTPMLWRCRVAC